MKTIKLSLTILSLILFFGCSTNSDTSGNSTTTVVPLVPSNLTGSVINNQVVLTWTDNSTNETGFKIERISGTGSWSVNGSVATNIFTYIDAGVTVGTTYTYRVYSFNSVGNSLNYSNLYTVTIPNVVTTNPYSFTQGQILTDIDGNSYPTIITNCSNQTWMQKNLNVSRYRNGDVIPQVTDPTAWLNLTTGAWCYYNNDPANGTTYGKLYNWYAVHDSRGLAPTGWHIPTDANWTTLTTCLGGEEVAALKMKEIGSTHWFGDNSSATNSSGFTGLPGGYRSKAGPFDRVGKSSYWWTFTGNATPSNFLRVLKYDINNVVVVQATGDSGSSVRCIKD